jgi:hypothetical protein
MSSVHEKQWNEHHCTQCYFIGGKKTALLARCRNKAHGFKIHYSHFCKYSSFLKHINSVLQGLSNCDKRTTRGTPATVQWYTGIVRKNQTVENKKHSINAGA